MAAVHLLVRTFPFAGPDVFTPTIRDRVVGRGRDQLAREVAASYISSAREQGVGDGDPLPLGGTGAVAGFRVFPTVTASGEVRRVGVLFRAVGEGGALTFTEYTLRLVWQDGDWRLTAPDWGDWRSAARVVEHPDPAAYTSYDDVDTVAASTRGAA